MKAIAQAFTIIELLIVIAIIATAMALIGTSLSRTNADAAVKSSAEVLASVLREARTLAMVNQAPYAVVFNIQNAPGSSGRVLNNRSGGHWYRILGPTKDYAEHGSSRQIALPFPWLSQTEYRAILGTFPRFVETVRRDWVSKPVSLPAGKVRFLALGETDEGNRVDGAWPDKAYGYAPTYPRPYFGYFDAEKGRLFPWGGYDHELQNSEPWKRLDGSESVTNYTGFFFEGDDGEVVGCRNPADRVRKVDWNLDRQFSGKDPVFGPEESYYVYRKDEPRPLVNADWLDSLIIFMPSGDAYMPPFGLARKRYWSGQALADPPDNDRRSYANGVSDRSKGWYGDGADQKRDYTTMWKSWGVQPNYEVGDFSRAIQGWHLTLSADSKDDRDLFPNAEAALRNIGPMYRVFVSRRGSVEVFRVKTVGNDWLDGKSVFPTDPKFFLGKTSGGAYGDDANRLNTTFRYGWLHLPKDSTGYQVGFGPHHSRLVPTGQPITRSVCPRMLSDKIWWLE